LLSWPQLNKNRNHSIYFNFRICAIELKTWNMFHQTVFHLNFFYSANIFSLLRLTLIFNFCLVKLKILLTKVSWEFPNCFPFTRANPGRIFFLCINKSSFSFFVPFISLLIKPQNDIFICWTNPTQVSSNWL